MSGYFLQPNSKINPKDVGIKIYGAIIAREYGIPMVATIQDITKKLKTGDKIKLNGTLGTIEIIK